MGISENTLTSIPDIRDFLFGGQAEFTLHSKLTGKHYTYRVLKSDWYPDPEARIAYYLGGNDNDQDFLYLGIISKYKPDTDNLTRVYLRSTEKSPDERSAVSLALSWFCRKLNRTELPDNVEFMHTGRCSACGRKLTTPESIRTGMGPVCRAKQ